MYFFHIDDESHHELAKSTNHVKIRIQNYCIIGVQNNFSNLTGSLG